MTDENSRIRELLGDLSPLFEIYLALINMKRVYSPREFYLRGKSDSVRFSEPKTGFIVYMTERERTESMKKINNAASFYHALISAAMKNGHLPSVTPDTDERAYEEYKRGFLS